jgi:hypothetical protein
MLPTDSEIKKLAQTGDVFRHAVVGFSAIEIALEELIAQALLSSHRVELGKLTFGFKVDLAIGLGLLHRDSKGLLIKLSKIRNHYAHEFKTGGEYCHPSELKSCFSESQRSIAEDHFEGATSFESILRVAFVSAFYEIRNAIARQQAMKIKRAEAMLHVQAVLAATEPTDEQVPRSEAFLKETERLDRLIEEKKTEIVARSHDTSAAHDR